ncbi:MAG: alpha/beta fold hydrolase [Actinomycetales bacterium]|nr:MAG: alpha/beta fold hydrolase [Actinomycetales bacterium]
MSQRISSFSNDGLTFDVIDSGPIDGDVVVLLHGFPERASSWEAVAQRLHAEGFRTLAPDQRGYSPGARPPRRRDYTVDKLVGDVAALIELTGGPVHLAGHDWGSMVAWSLAAARHDLVRTLTAFSVPHPAAYTYALTHSTQGLKSWYMGFFQLPRIPELLAGWRGGPLERWISAGGMTQADVDRFSHEIVEYGALPGALGWYRALPFADRAAPTRVAAPTTMVWSDEDMFIGEASLEGSPRFVDADYELVVLKGVTHWIPTQASDAAADAILERVRSIA